MQVAIAYICIQLLNKQNIILFISISFVSFITKTDTDSHKGIIFEDRCMDVIPKTWAYNNKKI
jgi:hypothetical protein